MTGVPGTARRQGGQTVSFANVPVGVLPITVTKVYATGTSASGIVSLW
jgi:hypothetical protein